MENAAISEFECVWFYLACILYVYMYNLKRDSKLCVYLNIFLLCFWVGVNPDGGVPLKLYIALCISPLL